MPFPITHNTRMATMILASVVVEGSNGYAQQIHTSAHQLNADEPERRGGTNTGPAPFELMLASLGACTAITLRMYSERKQWDLGTTSIKLRLTREGEEPPRIERQISVTGKIDGEQRQRLLEIAEKTPVSRVLAAGVSMTTVLETTP
jgi:putative redox protein